MSSLKLALFEPALCCTTGVCGPEPDRDLLALQQTIHQLEQMGVHMERYAINQQPAAFVKEESVKSYLKENGISVLPLTVLDGKIIRSGAYPDAQFLSEFIPELKTVRPASRLLAQF